MRTLAIIPARGGSKGVPKKNVRPLAGKPLIAWSIEQASASRAITDLVVSTDDREILDVAKSFGAEPPFLRPAELANDLAPTEPAMLHALNEMEQRNGRYDAVVLLQPTSPYRLPDTIDRAVQMAAGTAVDSVVGVVESHAFFWKPGPPVTAGYDFRSRPRRQDIAAADREYRETGSIYVTDRDLFVLSGNRLAGRIGLFHMAPEEGWEIDTLLDFAILEAIFESRCQ